MLLFKSLSVSFADFSLKKEHADLYDLSRLKIQNSMMQNADK